MHQTTEPAAAGPMTTRMQEFQAEVDSLKVAGGRANPERTWLRLGIAGWIVALVIEVIAYIGSHGTQNALSQRDFIIVALIGLTVAVIATGLFVTFSLTRYLRYWLIRMIYQDRETADRLVEAVRKP